VENLAAFENVGRFVLGRGRLRFAIRAGSVALPSLCPLSAFFLPARVACSPASERALEQTSTLQQR
jgi:hypothetical protein